MITLSEKKKEFIETRIIDVYDSLSEKEVLKLEESEDGGEATIARLRLQNFQKLRSAEELHFLMKHWNWDEGTQIPYQVLAHPACDRGTALMIYWMIDPDYYARYNSVADVPDYQQEDFTTLKNLEQRLLKNDFKSAGIKFVPSSYASWESRENPEIPDSLKVASEGEEFED